MLPLLETAATPSGGMTPTDTRPLKATHGGRRATSRRWVIGSVAAAIVAVAGVSGWMATHRGGSMPGPNRMAVLPITDVSGSDAELVQAMYNQLTVSLGQIPGITVAPPSAMEIYKTQPKPAADMARELHVGAILEGNLFRAGRRMRITLQLTNPHTIEQIWSQSFDIDSSGDLFDAIDGVIPQITGGIRQAVAAPAKSQ
jgi:TolB-like protein